MDDRIKKVIDRMDWLGHDTFRISDDLIIYTDPYEIEGEQEKADIILITHDHFDHLSTEDINRIKKDTTEIVGPPDCRGKCPDIITISAGEDTVVKGIKIEAVPAYNIDKDFHPKENKWIGFVFTVDNVRIYLAGDTDNIPEMAEIDCDIALLPVSGKYVMTATEAAKAALKIDPEVAIPMHYGAIIGSESDAEKFKDALKGKIEVHIFE